MVNFGPLAAEIVSLLWVTPANFKCFRVLAALLHGTPVLGITASAKLCGVEQRAPCMFDMAATEHRLVTNGRTDKHTPHDDS